MFPSSIHTHTNFSDGCSYPEEYVKSAIDARLKVYGFSDHAPINIGNYKWSMRQEKIKDYCETINNLKQKSAEKIQIYLGFEADYIIGINDARLLHKYQPDYLISAIHLLKKPNSDIILEIDGNYYGFKENFAKLFNNNAKELVKYYYESLFEMIKIGGFDIIGHADKIKMFLNRTYPEITTENWFLDIEKEAALELSKSNKIIEINTRSFYKKHGDEPYPSWEMIKIIYNNGGKLTLSADTHDPAGVNAFFEETIVKLKKLGINKIYCFKNGEFIPFILV